MEPEAQTDGGSTMQYRLRVLKRALNGPNTLGGGRVFWAIFALGTVLLFAQPMLRGAFAASQFTLYLALGLVALSLATPTRWSV